MRSEERSCTSVNVMKDQDENLLAVELWTAVGVVTPPLYTEEEEGGGDGGE